MFIPTIAITSWQDLQEKTRQLFSEMDYIADVSKQVSLAGRGEKEIDVYITDPNASYNRIYLVECKFWNHRVPQEIVHAFKTVMEEAGANTGFIISKVGFQSGAVEAARFTNIKLLTFEELQHAYGNEWFRKQKAKLNTQIERLRHIHDLHFDQWNNLGFHNNMFFHSPEQSDKLSYFHHAISNLIISGSASRWPESYLGPEPIKMTMDPNKPAQHVTEWFEIPTVRDYFVAMITAAKRCADEFDAFDTEAHDMFETLPEEEQYNLQSGVLSALREELPIRVLKRYVSEEEYTRLLSYVTQKL